MLIKSILVGRQIRVNVLGELLAIIVEREVLSSLLWNLAVNEIITLINDQGHYNQGYAVDLASLIRGKYPYRALKMER